MPRRTMQTPPGTRVISGAAVAGTTTTATHIRTTRPETPPHMEKAETAQASRSRRGGSPPTSGATGGTTGARCATCTGRTMPPHSGTVSVHPNHVVAKATAGVMDAFASGSHIGMIFSRSLYGGDQIVEAKCEACGTNIFYRTYRSDSSYGGVGRWGWTG